MKSKQTFFFAVIDDIKIILEQFESSNAVHYFETGMFENKNIPAYDSIFDTPNIGFTISGDWNKNVSYLVMKKVVPLNTEKIPQRTGEIKFAVDQSINPKSIELQLGGIYKENIIVAGRVATASNDEESNQFYKQLSTMIKKEFKRIGNFYVSKRAEEKRNEGWRLVTNDKSPNEYDL